MQVLIFFVFCFFVFWFFIYVFCFFLVFFLIFLVTLPVELFFWWFGFWLCFFLLRSTFSVLHGVINLATWIATSGSSWWQTWFDFFLTLYYCTQHHATVSASSCPPKNHTSFHVGPAIDILKYCWLYFRYPHSGWLQHVTTMGHFKHLKNPQPDATKPRIPMDPRDPCLTTVFFFRASERAMVFSKDFLTATCCGHWSTEETSLHLQICHLRTFWGPYGRNDIFICFQTSSCIYPISSNFYLLCSEAPPEP